MEVEVLLYGLNNSVHMYNRVSGDLVLLVQVESSKHDFFTNLKSALHTCVHVPTTSSTMDLPHCLILKLKSLVSIPSMVCRILSYCTYIIIGITLSMCICVLLPLTHSLTHLVHLIVGSSIALGRGHDLRFLPVPVGQHPIRATSLRDEVL